VDWTEGQIVWSVDGREFARLKEHEVAPYAWPFNGKDFYVILNMAVGGTLGGDVRPESFPAEMLVDYVKVSKYVPCD
jgi:beta-glucanase (GH16 family)